MSELREKLHAARLGYHTPLYPQDLASQLLPQKQSIWPRIIATLLAGAIAAAIVIVLLGQTVTPTQPARSERVPLKAPAPSYAVLPGLPQMPQNLTPPQTSGDQPVFLPSLPSLPSLGETLGGSNQSNEPPKEE
jgi:hypothetical protein